MAFSLPNPFDVLANPFAAAQGFVSQLPGLSGQRVTQMQTAGGTKTVALGDGFLDSGELAQWVAPVQQKIQALEGARLSQAYSQNNMGDMMPVLIVLLLGGGLGGGTGTLDTTTLLILMMLMGNNGGGGFGGGDNSTMMLMMVLLLGGSI